MTFQTRLDDLRREPIKAQSEIGQELQAEKRPQRGDLTRKVHEIRQMLRQLSRSCPKRVKTLLWISFSSKRQVEHFLTCKL
jgi:hypothetical protein